MVTSRQPANKMRTSVTTTAYVVLVMNLVALMGLLDQRLKVTIKGAAKWILVMIKIRLLQIHFTIHVLVLTNLPSPGSWTSHVIAPPAILLKTKISVKLASTRIPVMRTRHAQQTAEPLITVIRLTNPPPSHLGEFVKIIKTTAAPRTVATGTVTALLVSRIA